MIRRVLHVLAWPIRAVLGFFRWLGSRFHGLADFFTEVPEDVSLTDTIGEALGSRETLQETFMGLAEHIDALRRHLLRSVIVLAITTGLSMAFASQLMELLAVPVGSLEQLQTIEPTESIGVFMRVSLLAGVALAMPWIITEIYLFVAPGLMPRSRIMLALGIPIASTLFLAGMAFTYFVMLPTAVPFLRDFMDFRAAWRPSAYFGLVTGMMFWIGVTFQLPLIVYILAAAGLLNARQLARQWRLAVVVIAVLAAAITPTVDPVSMAVVMLPMALLYVFSIVGAAIAGAGRRRDLERHRRQMDMRPSP